jgi:signal transduction histidine kinase
MDEMTSQLRHLEQAVAHKDECVGILAHELRSPLSVIWTAVELLQMENPGDGELQEVLGIVARQSKHMLRMIEDLLDASRMLHGKLSIHRERVEVGPIAHQAWECCRALFEARRQSASYSLPAHRVMLDVDPTRLIQILTNLLNNAAKYTEIAGNISLTITTTNNEVVFCVRDDGIGIAPDVLPHVFELFSQADGNDRRSQGGLGIGLAVVGRLVQMHGGSIQAVSAGLGQGSEFTVRLPMSAAAC